MGISYYFLKFAAKKNEKKVALNTTRALCDQNKVFKQILKEGCCSLFGKNHNIKKTNSYSDFSRNLPISSYENYKDYISLISMGKKNVLTSGLPDYFAVSSGTTSGTKYIPITKKTMRFNTQAVSELLLLYAKQTNNYNLSFNSAMMFIQGSPELNYFNKMPFAKLSGISARHIPFFLKKFRYPSMKTNSIECWDKKIKAIVKETFNKNLRVIGGIPPWVITYFEALLKYTSNSLVKNIFPNLTLYIHGGTGFDPYKKSFFNICGKIDTLEVYPASEGFFAYQNVLDDPSLLLLTNHGIFYEFISLEDFNRGDKARIPLEGVQLNIDYILIISTVSGLWAYNTGDTVRFVSKKPYKIVFTGRASQFCSAFGEHVIEKEVQVALVGALDFFGGSISEFTVAPKINKTPNNSYHEWLIEFKKAPKNISKFEKLLNEIMCDQNIYYRDLIVSKIIKPLKISLVKSGGFNEYMKSIGKFGGQNKCPHLSNNRDIAIFLYKNKCIKQKKH